MQKVAASSDGPVIEASKRTDKREKQSAGDKSPAKTIRYWSSSFSRPPVAGAPGRIEIDYETERSVGQDGGPANVAAAFPP